MNTGKIEKLVNKLYLLEVTAYQQDALYRIVQSDIIEEYTLDQERIDAMVNKEWSDFIEITKELVH